MNVSNLGAGLSGPLPSLATLPASPAAQPTEPTAMPLGGLPDQGGMSHPTPGLDDMGPMGWGVDAGVGLWDSGEHSQLSEAVQATLMSTSTTLSPSLEGGTFIAINEGVHDLLDWLDTLAPPPAIQAGAGVAVQVPPASPPPLEEMRLAGRGQFG